MMISDVIWIKYVKKIMMENQQKSIMILAINLKKIKLTS
jgi:hypothetical protein